MPLELIERNMDTDVARRMSSGRREWTSRRRIALL